MRSYPTPVKYTPVNKQKYVGDVDNIIMRSSWESKLAHFLDLNDSVIKWGSESRPILYNSTVDRRVRRYFPDFFVVLKDREGKERRMIIEIKPWVQTQPPRTTRRKKSVLLAEVAEYKRNQEKWAAARKYANKIGWEFVVMTERELRNQMTGKF